jgi:hypothetical protein
MTTNIDSAIRELLDRQEIRDVLMRYCRGIDRLDMDLVKSCYHPDAYDDHGTYKGDVDGFCQAVRAGLAGCLATEHFLGNSLIEFRGGRAASETYLVAYHRLPAMDDGVERDLAFGGRYLDVFEQRNGGPWLIARRTVVHSWSRIDPVTEHWPSRDAFAQGQPGQADLVYHLLDRAPTVSLG